MLSNKSGSIKERNQTSNEMGTGCQRSTGSEQSSVRSWLVQPMSQSRSCCHLRRGCVPERTVH